MRRDIFTWYPVQDKNIVKHAKMGIMGFNQQDDQSIWELIPVENRMNTYLIRNVKYGEYLYASSFFRQLLVSNRRMVYTWKKSKHEMDGKDYYMWEMREPFVMMDQQNRLNLRYGMLLIMNHFMQRVDCLRPIFVEVFLHFIKNRMMINLIGF